MADRSLTVPVPDRDSISPPDPGKLLGNIKADNVEFSPAVKCPQILSDLLNLFRSVQLETGFLGQSDILSTAFLPDLILNARRRY